MSEFKLRKTYINFHLFLICYLESIESLYSFCFYADCGGVLHAVNLGHAEHAKHGGWMYKCDGGCKRSKSILYGTIWHRKGWTLEEHMNLIFHYARINHRVRVLLLFFFVNVNRLSMNSKQNRTSDAVISRNDKTKDRWLRIYRIAAALWMRDQPRRTTMLGGPGITCEFDESSFSKKQKYGRGAASADKWVFGIVERLPDGRRGRFRFWRVPKGSYFYDVRLKLPILRACRPPHDDSEIHIKKRMPPGYDHLYK